MNTLEGNVMNYRLYLGDCLDVMAELPEASLDALITDPPFTMAGGFSNGRSSTADSQFFAFWWRAVCEQLNRIMKPEGEGFIWCDWRTASIIAEGFLPKKQTYDVWAVTQMLYHYREMPGQGKPFRNSVDLIAYVRGPKSSGKRIPNTTHNWISQYWYYGKHNHHPAEKDVKICSRLVKWCSNPGDIILDPMAGSGTTGVACLMANRGFIGIEKDADFYRTAEERLAEVYQGPSIQNAPEIVLPNGQPNLFR